jgi:phenylalanyl-tRNA synthetase beta chain
MKFTFSWLKDHLETSESLNQIIDRLTKLGLEVESVVDPALELKGFKVAHILDAKPHPEADRLQVCTVDYGQSTPLQVVCGAPNARRGLKVVLGLSGTYVPALQLTLKETKIRGVESYGMLCSSKELGLGDNHEGIRELAENAPVGMEFVQYAGLDDPIIEVSVTPNRPDCLGVRGIARDLAAAGAGTLKRLDTPLVRGSFKPELKLTLNPKAQQACPHYMSRLILGVQNKPSPEWLQRRLEAVGVKPISALVDITNYISFDLCRPLHVFDLRSLQGNVEIRFAQAGESFLALDNKQYFLSSDMLVVADQEKVLALGGVMGGLESGCTLETNSILLESAYFTPVNIANTGRKLNLHSDSRYRFERGVDPLSARIGLEKATQLILEICGGEASDGIELGETELSLELACPHIPFDVDLVAKRTGVDLGKETAHKILKDLGFCILDHNIVVPPSFRPDITLPVDVVEEVIRVYGYDHLPEVDLPFVPPTVFPLNQSVRSLLRHLLVARSFMEVVTWSMVNQRQFQLFGGRDEGLSIINPITVDLEYLRPSVLVHLLKAVQQNLDRGLTPLSFFEIGPCYQGITPENQSINLAAVRVGVQKEYHWSKQAHSTDVFDIKEDLLRVLETCGIGRESIQTSTEEVPSWYHPGRSAWIQRGPKNKLGVFGEIHPSLLKEFGIKERVVAFELDLEHLKVGKTKPKGPLSLSPFQKVERDFCFLFEKSVKADKIITILKKIDTCITDVQIFDLYEGAGVPDGLKSISIHMTFEPFHHTFSEAEIKSLYDRVVQTVQTQLQGSLRL